MAQMTNKYQKYKKSLCRRQKIKTWCSGACFKACTRRHWENHENMGRDSWQPTQDSYWVPPK